MTKLEIGTTAQHDLLYAQIIDSGH